MQAIIFDENAKFLVTGGAGFIGSSICETLVSMGHHVLCLDNFSTGKRKNIEHLLANALFTLVEGDIRDAAVCSQVTAGVDFVLHQAAIASVPQSIEEPQLYHDINVTGTLNMLEAARINKVKKFVYASTSAIYGDDESLPKKEGQEGNLLSPYAYNKKANEEYAYLYSSLYGLDTYGLRYFNVFGKRQDPNGAYAAVVPKFITELLTNRAPEIYGNGEQTRDFTYIDNVVQANLRACLCPSEYAGQTFNIAYGASDNILELYETLRSLLDKDIEATILPSRKGDILHSFADISKAKKYLNYDPTHSFAQGIEQCVQWYQEQLS